MELKKDNLLPFILVAIASLQLATLYRFAVVTGNVDTTTANLLFVVCFAGTIAIYLCLNELFILVIGFLFKTPEQNVIRDMPTESIGDIKLRRALEYTEDVLAKHIAPDDMALLKQYITDYSAGVHKEIEKSISSNGLDSYDLFHFGWNIWNHFKFCGQEETAFWLQKIFGRLKNLEPSTIHKKMKHSDRGNYKIRILKDLK